MIPSLNSSLLLSGKDEGRAFAIETRGKVARRSQEDTVEKMKEERLLLKPVYPVTIDLLVEGIADGPVAKKLLRE